MKLIQDIDDLREYIPNVFRQTVPDAPDLFDKIRPFIEAAEQWLYNNFISEAYMTRLMSGNEFHPANSGIVSAAKGLVASAAWRDAIPSVDVVVSHNGLGVVETNTLKPASKAKIDALISSMAKIVDERITVMLTALSHDKTWRDEDMGYLFDGCFFFFPHEVARFPAPDDIHFSSSLDKWLYLRPTIISMQQTIAGEWISDEIMEKVLSVMYIPVQYITEREQVILKVRDHVGAAITAAMVRNDGILDPMFREIRQPLELAVSAIQADRALNRIWGRSEAGRLFRTRSFRNNKSSSAYWL